MQDLPIYISVLFVLISIGTIYWFYRATGSKTLLYVFAGWALIQTGLGLSGLYQDTEAMPPRIMLFGIMPTLVFIIASFISGKNKEMVAQTNLQTLTYFHSIRIPVEIVLTLLYSYGVISVYTTFEGTNFDIISGVTAPVVAFLCFRAGTMNKKVLMIWNVLCLLLLLNVVITAIFAFPSPFQSLAFEQPNIAPLYFPFNLLPTVVVPLVLYAHLIALRRLMYTNLN